MVDYRPDVVVSYDDTSDGADLEMKKWALHDGSRTAEFKGVRLAAVSSERENRPRWTEIEMYRSEGGYFVLHRVGVSAIIHSMDCDQIAGKMLPSAVEIKPEEIRLEDRVPCPMCRPDKLRETMQEDPASLRIEIDRHWLAVCQTAAEAVEALHTRRNDVKTLSFLARTLVKNAGAYDPMMAEEAKKL